MSKYKYNFWKRVFNIKIPASIRWLALSVFLILSGVVVLISGVSLSNHAHWLLLFALPGLLLVRMGFVSFDIALDLDS